MPRLYEELASWWPLMSPPDDYEEEADFYADTLLGAGDEPATTLLEFGSGGGHNASYLKRRFGMTLVELSASMLAVSRDLNPECEHVKGDMRTARLGRTFDRVFIHDAIDYMTTRADLEKAVETAYLHCRPGGAALFAPDHVRETFRPVTDHGGSDGDGRGMRFLEWVWDPDPTDSTYVIDYTCVLREGDGVPCVVHDRHLAGLFSRAEWLSVLSAAGFEPRIIPFDHSELEPGTYELFVGRRKR